MLKLAWASEAGMKRTLFLLAGLLLLTACASPAPAETAATAVPVEEVIVSSPDVVIASADVEPAQVLTLALLSRRLLRIFLSAKAI